MDGSRSEASVHISYCIGLDPVNVSCDSGVNSRVVCWCTANAPADNSIDNGRVGSILNNKGSTRITLAWILSTCQRTSTDHVVSNCARSIVGSFTLGICHQRNWDILQSVGKRSCIKKSLKWVQMAKYFPVTCSRAESSPATDYSIFSSSVFRSPIAWRKACRLNISVEHQRWGYNQENDVIIQCVGIVGWLGVGNSFGDCHGL